MLLEPFLLPTLISGLGWFTRRLWETDKDAPELNILLPVLQALVKPPSMSGESAALHAAVLSVISRPLQRSLVHVQKLHPRRADTEPLLAILKRNVQLQCHVASSHTELETWSSTPGGGVLIALRHTLQSLTQWNNSGSLDAPPPSYTHRLLLASVRMLGAKAVLTALIDEIMEQANLASNPLDVILDIVTSLIAAPNAADPSSIEPLATSYPKHQLSLRDALQAEYNEAHRLSKTDNPRAEIVVRLCRRVTAQLARSNQHANIVSDADANQMMLDLDNAAAVGGNVVGVVSGVGVGIGGGGGGGAMGTVVQNPEAVIDNVVAEAMTEIETQEFLSGSDAFMGI